ncbi:MAG: permease prefix domain 1-containing protein, partial [Terriglobales bacterium]
MMRRLRAFTVRMLALLRGRRAEDDFSAEIESHIAMHIEDGVRAGLSPEEARRRALIQIGGAEQVRQAHRERRTLPWVGNLAQDFRYGVRGLCRNPGFAGTVVFTLALGIGAATAMFTVVDHVLLRPLPFRDAGRLLTIYEQEAGGPWRGTVRWRDLKQWIAQNHSLSQIAFYGSMNGPTGDRSFLQVNGNAIPVDGLAVSPNLFATLGVEPALGRDFLPEQIEAGAGKNAGTIILSNAVWNG